MLTAFRRLVRVLCVLLGVSPAIAQSQGTTVTGTVTNEAGLPLQSVSVSVPSLNVGTYTAANGRYTLTIPAANTGQQVLMTARRLGLVPRSVTITPTGGTMTQDFMLRSAATQLTG